MATEAHTAQAGALHEPETDRAGHIEVRGIDVVPDSERHGRPSELLSGTDGAEPPSD
jgi:hypothetical protein